MDSAATPMPYAAARPDSAFQWLRTGEEAIRAMLSAIGQARKSIRMETYIFQADATGIQFREALVKACKRGVKVQVLVDAFGSMNLSTSFWTPLMNAGGEFAWFNPLQLQRWSYRDHRKLLVCDDSWAYVGGVNIGDEYNGDGVKRGWRDLGMALTGLIVEELAESFDAFFARATFKHKRLQRLRKASDQVTSGKNWKLLFSGPGRRHGQVKRTLVKDLVTGRSVQIACAYFLPTWRMRKELLRVSKRGGRVQLILAGKSDVALTQLAMRRLYRSFLRAGVEIYEYQPQILHAKLFLINDIVYVGSSNLDNRSLKINYELQARIEDPVLAAAGRAMFESDLAQCRRIDLKTWPRARSFWDKLRENWAYFVLARLDPYLARRQMKYLK
jgi:cardiolipin synthase A/B